MFCVSIFAAFVALPTQAGVDVVIPPGEHVFAAPAELVHVNSVTLEAGAFVRLQGAHPLVLVADEFIRINGLLDASGTDARDVNTLFTAWVPEPGAPATAGGGPGGTGSPSTTSSSPRGGSGSQPFPNPLGIGSQGGESAFGLSPVILERRPGGGAGGRFGPFISTELGLVALPGGPGHPAATGAESMSAPAKGGLVALSPFFDTDPLNDFWGFKVDPVSGLLTIGELSMPRGGAGGGAGGDSLQAATFPTVPFGPPNLIDRKGAGGGSGGGLVLLVAPRIVVGDEGRILANGGRGARGELVGLEGVGGCSGGGSGGMIVLEAKQLDLTQATAGMLQARGGEGGFWGGPTYGRGGNGGPGLIQLHVEQGGLLLPPGVGAGELSSPPAQRVLPMVF